MGWNRSGPDRVADWLRFAIRACFLFIGIIGSLLAVFVVVEAGMIFVAMFAELMRDIPK